MKKSFIAVFGAFLYFFCSLNCFAAGAESVNRRTAVRCLKLAESYLSSGDYTNALAQAELGLAYDESVADLWYVNAAAKSGKGDIKADIIPLVMKSLTEGEWVDYNRDGARVLYADLLCDTGMYDQALTILDTKPFIYSSDAEFIRVKAYYRIRTQESINRAREKINSARKIYPDDLRFPHIFFKYEYDINREAEILGYNEPDAAGAVLFRKIADSFIAKMPEYDKPDADLEIYSIYFAEGEKQVRMAQAFSSHGLRHPLYALIALKCGFMTQQEAWDYFCSFADEKVSLSLMEDFLFFVTDEVTVQSVNEHLDAYNGTILVDTDYDCDPNLSVKYMRGRPESFCWDMNNDGVFEWSAKCDFGVPEEITLTRGNITLHYGSYPAVVKAVFHSDRISEGNAEFTLMDETFEWTPVEIKPLSAAKELFGIEFFVPFVKEYQVELDEGKILYNCSSYEISSCERQNARIVFSVLNGYPQSAMYYDGDVLYARALFENGLPSVRYVDNDGDGIFEMLETFGYDPENRRNVRIEEQEQLMTNLFGHPVAGSGIYVRLIQLDFNADTIPDFTEEYGLDNGKISSWDYDGDRNWDVRFKRYPREDEDSPLIEDSQFYSNPEHILVTVTTWNGSPVKVLYGENEMSVTQGETKAFYWVGQAGTPDDEAFVLLSLGDKVEQGLSRLIDTSRRRIQVVQIGGNIYGSVIPDEEIPESPVESDE